MIISCKDKATESLFYGNRVKKFEAFEDIARRKLEMIHAAHVLEDLKIPPGNKLKQLKGKMHPKWSIRINDQWRVVFLWIENNASEVEIVDYH